MSITFDIRKPLYDNFVNLREDTLRNAIRSGERVWVKIPQYEKPVEIDPKEWIKTGKKIEQIFKRPNNPMKLVGNYVNEKTKNSIKAEEGNGCYILKVGKEQRCEERLL